MPRISGTLVDNRIRIKVGIIPFQSQTGPITVTNGYRECMALVDTGARRTCLTEKVVQDLQMQRIGQVEVWNVKRPERHWTYLFNVGIWPDSDGHAPSPFFGIGDTVEGIDVGNHPYFDVLLGMDIISQGRMLLDPGGNFEFTF